MLKSEVNNMCNFSEGVEEDGIKVGINKSIKNTIDIMRDLDIHDDIIAEKIEEKFELNSEEMKLFL